MEQTSAMQNGRKASLTVGDKELMMETKAKLDTRQFIPTFWRFQFTAGETHHFGCSVLCFIITTFIIGRRGMKHVEGYEPKEGLNPYSRVFDPEKCNLRLKNEHISQVSYQT
jgi:hypothetical protein